MTYRSDDLSITSANALMRTIKIDTEIRQWFFYLICRQEVKQELIGDKEIEASYGKLIKIIMLNKGVFAFTLGSMAFFVITRQSLWGILLVVFYGLGVFLGKTGSASIEKICRALIDRDFEGAAFGQKTLYQIGEYYGRKYNAQPLLGAMTSADAVTRSAALYMFIFASFIYPLESWQTYATVLIVWYIFSKAISPALVYRQVKRRC